MQVSHVGHDGPHTLERLLEMLGRYPLDPVFEQFGNFCYPLGPEEAERLGYEWAASGNFYSYSCAFSLLGSEEELRPVLEAVRLNQRRRDYKEARVSFFVRSEREKLLGDAAARAHDGQRYFRVGVTLTLKEEDAARTRGAKAEAATPTPMPPYADPCIAKGKEER